MQNYNSGQIGQTSVSKWNRPETEAQAAYFSTHAPKRRIYAAVQTAVQVLWAAVSFVALKNLFDWVFQPVPDLLFLSEPLAAFGLIVLHVLLRTTYQTYWFDRLDDRTETDSSPFLPLLIMGALVWLDYQGAKTYLAAHVEPPKKLETGVLDSAFHSSKTVFSEDYEAKKAEIDAVFAAKSRAATLGLQRQIERLERARPVDAADARFIRSKLSSLRARADALAAPVEAARADSLAAAFSAHQNALARAETSRQKATAKVEAANDADAARHVGDLKTVDSQAWLLSLFFMLVFAGLGYAIVRIHVKSGTLPRREYTDLDAHGSPFEKIWLAVTDATNRQLHRFAVWLHDLLATDARELRDFDGRVLVKENARPAEPPAVEPSGAAPAPSAANGAAFRTAQSQIPLNGKK